MTEPTPTRFQRLRARLARGPSPSVRSALVLVTALAGTAIYALVLTKTYPIKDWLFWRIGLLWAWGAYLGLACVSAGHLILSRVVRVTGLPTLETVVQSAALGLLAFVLGMYAGGFAHLYNPTFAVAWPAVMIAAGARDLFAFARERHAAWKAAEARPKAVSHAAAVTLATAFGVIGILVVYLEAMTPDAINFDSSWSHLPVAVDYARAGRIVRFDADYNRNFPHLASIVHTWALLVPQGGNVEPQIRWMQAQHLEFFFFLWTLAGIAAMARWLLDDDRVRGAWAAFFLFPAIFVYDSNLGGAADHYLAFFAAPFFLAAARAAPRFDARACAMAGAFAAGALLCKYQVIYLLAGIGLVMGARWLAALWRLVQARRSATADAPADAPTPRALVVGPLALVGALAAVSSPHFLKNWVFYGNPVYPFLQDVFHSHPTTPRADYLFEWLFKDYAWRPHGTFLANVVDAVRLCFAFSFQPHYTFTRNVPMLGSLFTLCLPFALVARSPRRVWFGILASMGALFAWGMTFHIDRNLQTFLPLLVATTAAILVRAWELGVMARVGVVALVALQVIWGGDAMIYSGHGRLASALELVRSGYEGRVKDRFKYRATEISIGKALPPDARVLLHMYRPNLGIDRDILLDWAGQQGLILYEDIHGPRSLHDFYRSIGVTHLLYIPGRRAASTKQEDVIFHDFVYRYGKDPRHFGGQVLVSLPPAPPPPDHPYFVLSLGLNGYQDGLYPLEAMKTYESVPENREKYAAPQKPLPADPAARAALVDEVDAVLLADRWKPDPELRSQIDRKFVAAATYARSFSIHVRKQGGGRVVAPASPELRDLEEPAN